MERGIGFIEQVVNGQILRIENAAIRYPVLTIEYYGLEINFDVPYKDEGKIVYECDFDVEDFSETYDSKNYDPDEPKQPLDAIQNLLIDSYDYIRRVYGEDKDMLEANRTYCVSNVKVSFGY